MDYSSSNNSTTQPTNNIQSQASPVDSSKSSSSKKPTFIWGIGAVAILAVVALGVFGIFKLLNKPDSDTDAPSPTVMQYHNLDDFDFSFLKQEADSKNIIYSPLSIRNALALLYAGANGETREEIGNVLTNTNLPKYQNIPDELSLANAIFVRNTFKDKVLPAYSSIVQNDYDGEILFDSFVNSSNMDNWIDQKTFGLINSIGITPSNDTQMVLANALAIQMDWEHQFETDRTHGAVFYEQDGSEIIATTMFTDVNSSDVKYYTDDNIEAISMPLSSTNERVNLDFIAIMPSGDLDEYISTINTSAIEAIIKKLIPTTDSKEKVIINIPKFKYDYQLSFKNDLESLGIRSAFNEREADFSNMSTDALYVNDAVHKSNIDFSEDGIKAAAVTAFEMSANSAEEESIPINISIDHPFLFLIRDADNGTVWFTGTVYRPNLWSDDSANYR